MIPRINLFLIALFISTSALCAPATTSKKKKVSIQDLISSTTPSGKPTPVAGVRGLDEPAIPLDTQARDFPAIEALERVVIHEDELATFMAEGKLR